MKKNIFLVFLTIFFSSIFLFREFTVKQMSLLMSELEEKTTDLEEEVSDLEKKIYKEMMLELQIDNFDEYNNSLDNHLRFAVFADTPYNEKELNVISQYLNKLNYIKKKFVVHLGDIKPQDPTCAEKSYSIVSEVFLKSTSPVFFIPGDNDWNDCANPELAWKLWLSKLYKFEENWSSSPNVEYQVNRIENFSWIENKVLIIGINLVNGRINDQKEWDFRLEQNAEWVRTQLLVNQNIIDAAIIFAHSSIKNRKNLNFNESFIESAQLFKKPILYMSGDEHRWLERRPFPKKAPNVTQIVSKGGDSSPILITVNLKETDPFKIQTIKL